MENEHIDISEQLPLSEVKRYGDFAEKRGRIEYNNGMIIPSRKHKLVIDRICDDERIIGPHHRDIGIRFKILRDCTEGRININDYTHLQEPILIDPALKQAAIYTQLTLRQSYIIDRVLFGVIRENDYGWLRMCKQSVHDAFDRLIEAYDPDNVAAAILVLQKKALDKRHTEYML